MNLIEKVRQQMAARTGVEQVGMSVIADEAVTYLNDKFYVKTHSRGRLVDYSDEVVPFSITSTGYSWAISCFDSPVIDSENLTGRDEQEAEESDVDMFFRNLEKGMKELARHIAVIMTNVITTDEINRRRLAMPVPFRGQEHNVNDALHQEAIDRITRESGVLVVPGDLWVHLDTSGHLLIGYLTRAGEIAIHSMEAKHAAGAPLSDTRNYWQGDPE